MKHFGTLASGDDVHAITITNGPLTARILTYGAILQDVRLDGVPYGLTLGSDQLVDYEDSMRFHGSVPGPVANRISNATTVLHGETLEFEKNTQGGHSLHGGQASTHSKIWAIDYSDDKSAALSLGMPHLAGGYPGNRKATARFSIEDDATLRLTLTTITDRPSIANLTNHSYWNLDGSDTFMGHQLQIPAERYLPTTQDDVPTGEIASVSGTPFDFRTLTPLVAGQPALDNTFCVAPRRGALKHGLTLVGKSGISLRVCTTEPGMHIFDARNCARPNRKAYEGIAIEAQGWPDAPNNPNFPSIEISQTAPSVQTTTWQFSTAKES